MTSRVTDLHVARNVPLPAPALLHSEIPRSDEQADFVARSRDTIGSILFGELASGRGVVSDAPLARNRHGARREEEEPHLPVDEAAAPPVPTQEHRATGSRRRSR